MFEAAWYRSTPSGDVIHFTQEASESVCDDNKVAMLTNAQSMFMQSSLILCDKFFDSTLPLPEQGTPPTSDELGTVEYAPGPIMRELLGVISTYRKWTCWRCYLHVYLSLGELFIERPLITITCSREGRLERTSTSCWRLDELLRAAVNTWPHRQHSPTAPRLLSGRP